MIDSNVVSQEQLKHETERSRSASEQLKQIASDYQIKKGKPLKLSQIAYDDEKGTWLIKF